MTCRYLSRIGRAVSADGVPGIVVGILRGGMIPAVRLAHLLGIRTVRAVELTRTLADEVNAAKTPRPVVANPGSLGDVSGQDVLIVDDIAGSGLTMLACKGLVEEAGAARVRTAAMTVNAVNWELSRSSPPAEELTYVGHIYRGWVTFPWERR
jgi:hypoxanthine phosphoribosyltransferase